MTSQNWEYCAIAGVTISSGGRLHAARERTMHYFNERGVRIVNVNVEDENALGLAIAGLGAQGWDLVGFPMASFPSLMLFGFYPSIE